MAVSISTIEKLNSLSDDKQQLVISLIDQLSMSPVDVLTQLREQGLKNPMEMDEIDAFIAETRKEKC